ncbi:MAG: four helix bundle protein [Desulfoferrobacter sp.]
MRPHHKLAVWKRSIDFVKQIYELTAIFPAEEKFGLVSQMRRAAVSIASNIAEGAALNSHAKTSFAPSGLSCSKRARTIT